MGQYATLNPNPLHCAQNPRRDADLHQLLEESGSDGIAGKPVTRIDLTKTRTPDVSSRGMGTIHEASPPPSTNTSPAGLTELRERMANAQFQELSESGNAASREEGAQPAPAAVASAPAASVAISLPVTAGGSGEIEPQ